MRNPVHKTAIEALEPRSLLSAGQPAGGDAAGGSGHATVTNGTASAAGVGAQLQRIRQNLDQVRQDLNRIQDAVVRMRQGEAPAVFSAVKVDGQAEPSATSAAGSAPRAEDFDAVGHGPAQSQMAQDRMRSYQAFSSR